MTGNVGINSGQHIIQQYQVRTSIDGAGKSDASSLTTTQLLYMSVILNGFRCDTHRDTLFSYFCHISVRKKGQVWPECTGWGLGLS
jgi:hypothetical protein